jgi:polyisoprenoid-binding protein YceI
MILFKKHYFRPMNNKISVACLILAIALLSSAFRGPVVKENENNGSAGFVSQRPVADEKYVIDKKESVVTWKGSMVIADNGKHTGYVYLSKGELKINKGQLVGGTFEIDMTTIEYKDKAETNSPVHHLKSADFFHIYSFPISTFAITKVKSLSSENIEVIGNLTIKDVTQAITFPAKIEVKDGVVHANGKVTIDRTRWGIRYKSDKFFDVLADEAISDDIEFEMKIVARK